MLSSPINTVSCSLAAIFTCLFSQASLASTQRNLLIFGDSLSAVYGVSGEEAWPSLLQKKLNKEFSTDHYRVINLSISGETTEGGLLRLPQALKQYKPNIIVLELGVNDGFRGESLKAMQANLQKMIDLSREANAVVMLAAVEMSFNHGQRYTNAFDQVFSELGQNNEVILMSFISLEELKASPGLLQADGVHPSNQAQPVILKRLWNYLKPVLQLVDNEKGLRPW